MIGLNKLGTAITVIIALTLTALFLEILYVVWRHHRFRFRRCNDSDSGSEKHILHFLCCKHKSRVQVEPQETSLPTSSSSPPELGEQVMKWQCLYGPSRVLFTIKEEEREGLDSENCSSADSVLKTKRACYTATATTATESAGGGGNVEEVAVAIELNETTPFSTPCASPPYFTPSSSPTRELGNRNGCLILQSAPENQEPVTVFSKSNQQKDIQADTVIHL